MEDSSKDNFCIVYDNLLIGDEKLLQFASDEDAEGEKWYKYKRRDYPAWVRPDKLHDVLMTC